MLDISWQALPFPAVSRMITHQQFHFIISAKWLSASEEDHNSYVFNEFAPRFKWWTSGAFFLCVIQVILSAMSRLVPCLLSGWTWALSWFAGWHSAHKRCNLQGIPRVYPALIQGCKPGFQWAVRQWIPARHLRVGSTFQVQGLSLHIQSGRWMSVTRRWCQPAETETVSLRFVLLPSIW